MDYEPKDNVWDEANRIKDILGAEAFLHALMKALPDDDLEDYTAYICRCEDIDTNLKERD